MDAYQRAAELDPSNVHIKARLQLLRNGQTNGMPGPTSAPLPQDVHPNAYQATGAVGPPGPQWGNSAAQQAPPAPAAPSANGWQANRLADINPPQPPNPYDQQNRRGESLQALPLQRQPSPRQEQQMRSYQDPIRHTPMQRGPSPPRDHAPVGYAPLSISQLPPAQAPPTAPQRVMNPNYAAASTNSLPAAPNGTSNGPQAGIPPYGRGSSPRTEIRPIIDNRMPSPKSSYPVQQSYSHHPDSSNPGGIAGGAPPPASAIAAAEVAALDRAHDRPSSVGPKRLREWEDESTPVKKAASDENRARMDDMHHRRPSTPPRDAFRRSSSEARRAEDQRRLDEQRRANDGYHPSEAAHHPQQHSVPAHLPPMQTAPGPAHEPPAPPPPALKDYPMEDRDRERPEHPGPPPPPPPSAPISEPERAARKMDVDEDYDDEGDDEKKSGVPPTNGSGPGSAADDKSTSPVVNGHSNSTNGQGPTKVETPS